MSDQRKPILTWVVILLLLMAALAFAFERRAKSKAEERATAAQTVADHLLHQRDSLALVADSLSRTYAVDTVQLTRWRTRWDSIVGPGRTDTLTLERVVAVADTTIRACTAALSTCELRVAAANQQTALERERGDSLQSAATNWKRAAKGPFIGLAVEGTLTSDFQPQAAGEVTLGRGKLRVLGRVEVGEGAETCAFSPTTDAYTCSTPVDATVRFGARWVF